MLRGGGVSCVEGGGGSCVMGGYNMLMRDDIMC